MTGAGLAATASYVIGVLGVTVGGNIPLNNALAEVDLTTVDDDAVTDARRAYEGPWNRLHYARTVAAVVALALVSVAALTG